MASHLIFFRFPASFCLIFCLHPHFPFTHSLSVSLCRGSPSPDLAADNHHPHCSCQRRRGGFPSSFTSLPLHPSPLQLFFFTQISSSSKISNPKPQPLPKARMKMEQKLNTGFGIRFVQSWLPPFLVGLMKYGLNLVHGCFTLGLLLEPQSLMCLTLLVLLEWFMQWNFLIEVVLICFNTWF
ncbi:uncharacterized protein LOC115971632 [Quercus lobata]|uniref:uncharacterized protein LOC115971632 n=1 Tax=Quercus lobata TaxID=97700 RepID=UPI001248377F|nr:uncharacterized protein LOC115971632 [Quercus lobata]